MTRASDTRSKILAAALELFAERGYTATSVGEIEAAAGLAPRSGALYKHFPSKEALLDAALSERIAEIDAFNERLVLEPLGDLRAELTLVASWGLAELARERDLIRIVMRDGGRVPELAERFHATVVKRGIALATGDAGALRSGARGSDRTTRRRSARSSARRWWGSACSR